MPSGATLRKNGRNPTDGLPRAQARGHRKKANSSLKKAGKDLSEDAVKGAETQVQKLTDDTIKEVDKVVEAKEKEIMKV